MLHRNILRMSKTIQSFALPHYSNVQKQNQLWELYDVCRNEHGALIRDRWRQFRAGTISHFNYLGSTKQHKTALSQSYFQGCLKMACTGLNTYTANVAQRFNDVSRKSSIKDPTLLHQLHTINSNREWMKPESFYYPKEQVWGMDDYGDRLKLDLVKRYAIQITLTGFLCPSLLHFKSSIVPS